jgi:hypothetical protein
LIVANWIRSSSVPLSRTGRTLPFPQRLLRKARHSRYRSHPGWQGEHIVITSAVTITRSTTRSPGALSGARG